MQGMTAKEAYEMLQQDIRSHPDMGIWNAVKAATLKPQNPFDSQARPKPKLWLVLFLVISCCFVGTFAYFNH